MKTIVLLLSLLMINFFNPFDKISDNTDEVTQKLDLLMNECTKLDIFSGTVLVAKDGNVIFEKSYGEADKEINIPNANKTKYNIGSIGKEFTAIMILQLAQENKLSLNDNLGKYLGNFPAESSSKVSIKNLLNHSSGFRDYIMNPEFQKAKDNYTDLSELLKLISKEELLFTPGTGKSYSNSGYAVLGGIIESVTGKGYIENLKERILIPLDMNSSGYIYWDETDPLKATGYIKDIKGNERSNKNLRLQPTPAGGMYSTVEDLLKLDKSLMNDNKLLDDDSKVLLFNHFDDSKKVSMSDLKSNPKSGNSIAGGAPGINALYMQLPGKGYTVIILSNYDQAAEGIEKYVTQILNGEEYDKPKLPLNQCLYQVYEKEGLEFFSKNLKKIINDNGYEIEGDGVLNNIGYQFMQNEIIAAAIEIFNLNVEMFPGVENCYDSLGEAYLIAGNKTEAKRNYEKVLELDPGNENAIKMLEKISR